MPIFTRDRRVVVGRLVHVLRERMADAEPWQLEAAKLLTPLLAVASNAEAWAQNLPVGSRQAVDEAVDSLDDLPLGEMPAWQLRLVHTARSIRQYVDGA